jgi:hypothetical protein
MLDGSDGGSETAREIAPKEIFLGEAFGPVTIRVNGATIDVSSNGTVKTQAVSASDSTAREKPAIAIGDEMPDGTIYAGISPDTHKPMYATPKDSPGTFTFNQAARCSKLMADCYSPHDFRVPSKGELNVLFENRHKGKLAGRFNEAGSEPAAWYWSASPNGNLIAWAQCFSDGYQINAERTNKLSLRLVRG